MRSKIVAGNWKMNNDQAETSTLIDALKAHGDFGATRVIIAPSFVHLAQAVTLTADSGIEVAAQNMHEATSGAYTGEVSPAMLSSVGIQTVILGHSERRAYFGENDATLAKKSFQCIGSRYGCCFLLWRRTRRSQIGQAL